MKKKKKVLLLYLTKQWFDLIAAEIKNEEYRKISRYYASMLENKEYDVVIFANGFNSKKDREIVVKLKSIHKGTGNPDWGAEPGKDYYILKLGRILEHSNFNLKEFQINFSIEQWKLENQVRESA